MRPLRESIVRFVVKHPWLTATALVVLLATGAAVVVVSGIVPIKASSGHWRITAVLLDFAKVRSVATHSWGVQPPPLDDEGLVIRGAGHYAVGCYSCHGAPDARVPPVMAAMLPEPPELTGEHVARWEPEELFVIVKHGLKFTGMPAWPTQRRDDEVWAVVAFLRRMPTLDGPGYRRMVYGDAGVSADPAPELPSAGGLAPPPAVRAVCWRCHSVDGTGRGPGTFPSLAGQRAAYLYSSMRAFADRARFSGTMNEIASRLDDESMRDIAAYYERLPARAAAPARDASSVERGAALAARGVLDRDIPACVECHGPSAAPKNPAYPKLAAQHPEYLALQLRLLKERRRGGSPRVNLMHAFVDRLDAEEIKDVALYFATGAR